MNIFKSIIIIIIFFNKFNFANAKETYFDLSENKIKINTDFTGKEIIIFGILEDNKETILTIKGPLKNSKIQKKERIFGFWFNTKYITYKNIPSSFFIAASSKIDNILPVSTLIKEELSFDYVLENKISNRNFISNDSQNIWKKNFVRLKKNKNLFKEYEIKNINDKLFQTRVFFPPNSIPGKYIVSVYQIKNNIITERDNKIIIIEKSGIGSKIYHFAHNHSAAYGLFAIIFAIISGLLAATLFRRS